MPINVKEIESAMNDFIVKISGRNNIVYGQLPIFHNLSDKLIVIISKFYENCSPNIDYEKITKMSLYEKLDIIKGFYQQLGVEIDLEQIIADGTLDFKYNDIFYDNENFPPLYIYGLNYYNNGHKSIDAANNGLVTDICLIIHEISHFRNQPEFKRNQVNDLLTETIAYTEEFIFADYLSKLGYKSDIYLLLRRSFILFYNYAKNMKSVYKMFILYEELGSISKEDYKYYFEDDKDYEDDLKQIQDASKNNFCGFFEQSWYILAVFLAAYLYQKYKNDNSFIDNINKLHSQISTNNILECFSLMGLNSLNEKDINTISDSLTDLINGFETSKTLCFNKN